MIPWFLLREDEDAVLFCHTFPLYKHTSPFCVYTMPMKLPFTAEPHSILSLFLFCTGFSFFVQLLFHLGCHWLRFLFFIFLTPFFIDLIFCLGKTNFFFFKSSDKITHIKQSMFSTLKKKNNFFRNSFWSLLSWTCCSLGQLRFYILRTFLIYNPGFCTFCHCISKPCLLSWLISSFGVACPLLVRCKRVHER